MKKFSFFQKKSSGEIAKDRLKILLISDRVQCSPETLEMMKKDLIKSISKYLRIDSDHTEIILKRNRKKGRNKEMALYASIPILENTTL